MKLSRIYIAILVTGLWCLSACSDFLEEKPVSFYDEATVYNSEAGVETAVNGMYYILGSFNYYGSSFQSLIMPVSGIFYSSQTANRDATSLNTTPSNPNLNQIWTSQYQLINASNIAIANLEKDGVTFTNKNTALGHAYFLRGLSYFELVRFFGSVPLRTSPASIDGIHSEKASRADIIAQVEADLTKAQNLMPEAKDATLGRPGKLAANVLLAKLYMYEAGLDPSLSGYWQKAHDVLLPVITSEVYELAPTFAELFRPNNDNTKESIFEIQYGNTGGGRTSDIVRLYTPSNSTYVPVTSVTFGRIRPNKEFFDGHLALYPDDPRINATYVYNEYPKAGGGTQRIYPKAKTGNNAYPVIAKWFDPAYNGNTTERNYFMLRYADVLLMMAEIKNELTGPDAAYTYINQVLARARDTNGDGTSDSVHPMAWSGMSKEQFRNRIMRERLYELLSEGQEWFDTRRRGYEFLKDNVITLHNNNPTFDPDRDYMYPDNPKNLLLPIPLSELSGNQLLGPEDQNPGY